ncbi:MAG: TIGR02452 family protein [Clostridiales bacterium]|jgi:uncharacterized protein (TIGR02452 family)|nr:TIGR02452 family protein [Clostridiales bacterium]MDR2712936.1 TIGR02452 family protein [Clostridiales bacterium]
MKNREQRSALAQETVRVAREGKYIADGVLVDISQDVSYANTHSVFISQSESDCREKSFTQKTGMMMLEFSNESTLSAIFYLQNPEDKPLGVLNFASAKNPGGGFLSGAMAQEESLAAVSNLYDTLLQCPEYYEINKAHQSFRYTDCAIWSPDVVFFRDEAGRFLRHPAKASVLTLPAVNYGQVLRKGEDARLAKTAMKRRMKIALATFADKGCKAVILGAYGCGVFRNDPEDVAAWWDELLMDYGGHFKKVFLAVLDRSPSRETITAFARIWG